MRKASHTSAALEIPMDTTATLFGEFGEESGVLTCTLYAMADTGGGLSYILLG